MMVVTVMKEVMKQAYEENVDGEFLLFLLELLMVATMMVMARLRLL